MSNDRLFIAWSGLKSAPILYFTESKTVGIDVNRVDTFLKVSIPFGKNEWVLTTHKQRALFYVLARKCSPVVVPGVRLRCTPTATAGSGRFIRR